MPICQISESVTNTRVFPFLSPQHWLGQLCLAHQGPLTSFEADLLVCKVPDPVAKGSSRGHQDHQRGQDPGKF